MLRTSDVLVRPDFALGPVMVSPARRLVWQGERSHHLEPRVLQVLICLVDADGGVVTRQRLFDQVWGGAPVGDDSIDRAIAKLRRALDAVAPGALAIETIPRTGYRLDAAQAPATPADPAGPDRRRLFFAGTIGALAVGVAGSSWLRSGGGDPGPDLALRRADRALRDQYADVAATALSLLAPLVRDRPDDPATLGLLALAHRAMAEQSPLDGVDRHVSAGLDAAARALDLDPDEVNARVAMATLRPELGYWDKVEDGLRAVLADHPRSIHTLLYLTMLMQGVGRGRESAALNERTIAVDPMTPIAQFRAALKHWIFARPLDAQRSIDRSLRTWPRHSAIWSARAYIYMFTGRAADFLRELGDRPALPRGIDPSAIDYYRASARAIASGASADRAAAVRIMLDASARALPYALTSIMTLSHLGEVDAAFAVAEGAYLSKGPFAAPTFPGAHSPKVADQYWPRTMNLFTPATERMRTDPRFLDFSEAIGLARYWQVRGLRPDPFFHVVTA